MNAETKIEAAHRFNPLAAYEAEREENRRLWEILNNVLFIAEAMIGEAERRGEDVISRKAVVAKAREERWAA